MVKNGFMAMDNQRPPLDLSGYHVVVFPGKVFQKPEYAEDLFEYRDVQGIELIAHLPACYMKLRYHGMFYDAWKALADKHDGWLLDRYGGQVVDGFNSHILDMRASKKLARKFAAAIVTWLDETVRNVGCMPTGLFLDCTWDDIWGTAAYFGHPLAGDKDEINADWRAGMRQFIAALRFRSRQLFNERPPFYGNGSGHYGWNLLDGICFESWPVGWYGTNNPNRNAHTALTAKYGLFDAGRRYRLSPMLIPRSNGQAPGDGVTPEDAVLARAWLGHYGTTDDDDCEGIVFDNAGTLLGVAD